MSLLIFVVLTLVDPLTSLGWQDCYPCTCHLSSGVKRANCMQVKINGVPQNLSSDIEEIYLSHQTLETLPANAFYKLANLQKLFIDRCNLTYLDKNAFRNLNRLTDLSAMKNQIRVLPATLFQSNLQLKYIWLDNNQIQSFPNGLFSNLTSLNGLYARFNQINYIGPHAFGTNPNLWLIDLTNNKLKRMDATIIEHLKSVTYLFLHDNQWICDCNLRKLRQIMEQRHIFHRSQPNCSEPKALQGQKWSNLKPNQFKCWLEFINPEQNITHIITSGHAILSCFITSNSEPIVTWSFKTNLLTSKDKYIYETINVTPTTFGYNLTILNLTASDSGDYKCATHNEIGVINRYFSLTVVPNKKPMVTTNKNATTNDDVELSCRVHGFPAPKATWVFNDSEIFDSQTDKYILSYSSINPSTFWYNLTIINVTNNNLTGKYSCVAVNVEGSDSDNVYLIVQTLNITEIKIRSSDEFLENADVILVCLVRTVLKPNIYWEFNEVKISDGGKYKVSCDAFLCNLTIFEVQSEDEGAYKCIANNNRSSGSEVYDLKVKSADNSDNISMFVLFVLLGILFIIPIITYACTRCMQQTEKYKVEAGNAIEENKNMQLTNENEAEKNIKAEEITAT